MGKKISELTNRQQLSGNEDLPFQEGQDNGSITIHSLNEYISNSNVNQAINQIKQAEQQAISNFSSQKVSPEMLSESTKQLINASGGGTITNLADDEDIESVGQDLKVLKFADRAYNPGIHVGMGYKILRRNIIDGKNILTQDMVNQPHTIYMIQYDFDLDGAQITIPENCILKFDGGSLSNGKLTSIGYARCINSDTPDYSNELKCDKVHKNIYIKCNISGAYLFNCTLKYNIATYKFTNSLPEGLEKIPISFLGNIANNSGKTEDRPTNADKGFQYYDTDINKPIWWNGFSWTDASGTTV